MTNTYAPILLFVYNRPEHVRRNIQALLKNELAAESELFIYSDAAKDETSQAAVKEVRAFIRSIQGFKKITITERAENWGLARSIIDGVTTLISRYGRVIVLEDDLVVAPHFLQFMNDALETYRDEERVGHIQACDFTHDPSLPDTFLIKWTGKLRGWGSLGPRLETFQCRRKGTADRTGKQKSLPIPSTLTANMVTPVCCAGKLKVKIIHGPFAGMLHFF